MKRIVIAFVVGILSTGCASTFLNHLGAATDQDLRDALVLNTDRDVPDPLGAHCVVWIAAQRPVISRILNAKTSGPFSLIAKRRAIELLREKLQPEFEQACAPVLMDERQRIARFSALFGR